MNDPYVVLGASPSDSDEEIKKKYRDLVKKYHPDNYNNNPLADLAQEKMKEINEAYDAIQKMRERGSSDNSGYSGSGSYKSRGSAEFAGVRSAINSGDLAYAERILESSANRNAEWNFLMGSLCYRKGWLDEAQRYFRRAVNMEPSNMEYRQAYARMQNADSTYRPAGYQHHGIDLCDICTMMICADACCRC